MNKTFQITFYKIESEFFWLRFAARLGHKRRMK